LFGFFRMKPFGAMFSGDKELYTTIRNIFGYYPGNISLYKLAFRHKSVAIELRNGSRISNERLEYLGDAILGAIVAEHLFKLFPYKDEGFLTEMRSKIVSRVQLNKLSQKLGIDNLIQVNTESGNVYRSMKGDAFEAFVGALYLDKGYDFTRNIIINHVIRFHFDLDDLINTDTNFKSKFIEWGQRERKTVGFLIIGEVGSGYNKQYVVDALVNGKMAGRGQDFSIKGAEQSAAMKAMEAIVTDQN
jgi:ribonuclease III